MRTLLVILSLLATGACAGAIPRTSGPADSPPAAPSAPPAPAATPAPAERSSAGTGGLRNFPDLRVALADMEQYDDPRLGVQLQYHAAEPAVRIDVYVYPMAPRESELPDAERDRLVRRMYDLAKEGIREYERRGRYSGVRFSEDAARRLEVGGEPVEGWSNALEMALEGEPVLSHLHLYGHGNLYVKFRSTYAAELGDSARDLVERFVVAFLQELGAPGRD